MTKLIYAGIGPRSTPVDIRNRMKDVARTLAQSGWTLRSGHAEGADQAFECGAGDGPKEIYLPWNGFNKAFNNGKDTGFLEPSTKQTEIAMRHHPNWDACSNGAKLLLIRNVPIILGETLDDPVDCVIYQVPHTGYQGGTAHALKIASTYGIPTFNIRFANELTALSNFTLELEKRAQLELHGREAA